MNRFILLALLLTGCKSEATLKGSCDLIAEFNGLWLGMSRDEFAAQQHVRPSEMDPETLIKYEDSADRLEGVRARFQGNRASELSAYRSFGIDTSAAVAQLGPELERELRASYGPPKKIGAYITRSPLYGDVRYHVELWELSCGVLMLRHNDIDDLSAHRAANHRAINYFVAVSLMSPEASAGELKMMQAKWEVE